MWKNCLIIAWRNLIRYPGYSLINLIGLSIGLAACFCMLTFAWHESSFENQYSDHSRIYALKSGTNDRISAPVVTGKMLNLLSPHQEGQFEMTGLFSDYQKHDIKPDGGQNYKEDMAYLSGNFFDIFDMEFLEGSSETALSKPLSVVLSKRLAKKYFGNEPALNKVLTLDNQHQLVVSAVIDFPKTTHLMDQVYISKNSLPLINPFTERIIESGANISIYLKLAENVEAGTLRNLITELNYSAIDQTPGEPINHALQIKMIPIDQLHLNMSHGDSLSHESDNGTQLKISNRAILNGAIGVALLILIVACLNFTNLSLAFFNGRHKEIAIRQTNGATRKQLFNQYLAESISLTLLSAILAVAILPLMLGLFGNLIGRDLIGINPSDPQVLLIIFLFSMMIGTLLGLYPAKVMASRDPAGGFHQHSGQNRHRLQKILISIQFSIATTVIIVTLFASSQLNTLSNFNHGLDTENTYRIDLTPAERLPEKYEALLKEWMTHPDIVAGSRTETNLFQLISSTFGVGHTIRLAGSETRLPLFDPLESDKTFMMHGLEPRFVELTNIKLLAGQNFTEQDLTIYNNNTRKVESAGGIIITEKGMGMLGIEGAHKAIGKKLIVEFDPSLHPFTRNQETGDKSISESGELVIVGVSTNVNFGSAYNPSNPAAMFYNDRGMSFLIKTTGKNHMDVVSYIHGVVISHFPNKLAKITSIRDIYQRHNLMLTRIVHALIVGALLSIVLASLGLYALSAMTIAKRSKEIGLRKILGSSSLAVTRLLLWNQTKPVFAALLIALPCGYLISNRLLQYFPHPVSLSPLTFALAAGISLCIAWLTMAAHALKAANNDPALELRDE